IRPLSTTITSCDPAAQPKSGRSGLIYCLLSSTTHIGLRPFGVSFIYAGYDNLRQFQLYQSNPSGNYGGWKATSGGANNASAQSLLKQDYKEDCDLKEACGMAVKVLSKTMDSTKLSSEKSESIYPCLALQGGPGANHKLS